MAFMIPHLSGCYQKIDKIASNKQFGEFLAAEANKGMANYIPVRTGNLQGSGQPSPFNVHYEVSYAKKIFEGKGINIISQGNPLGTSRWDKAYEKAHVQELAKAGTEFLKRL